MMTEPAQFYQDINDKWRYDTVWILQDCNPVPFHLWSRTALYNLTRHIKKMSGGRL